MRKARGQHRKLRATSHESRAGKTQESKVDGGNLFLQTENKKFKE